MTIFHVLLTAGGLSSGSRSEHARQLVIASQVYLPFDGRVLHVVNRADIDATLTKRSMEVPLASSNPDATMV
jgi:hypothetical protein